MSLFAGFEILERYPRLTLIHHVQGDGTLWATAGRTILSCRGASFREVAAFPFVVPRDLFGFSRPTARAFRADKCNLFVNSSGSLIAVRAGTVYSLAGRSPSPLFHINGDCALHGGICEDIEGWTYIGEYFMNPARECVRIWRLSPDLATWEIAHEFPAGSIRHVHGLYQDPFEPSALWITTGDSQGECHLFYTNDRFRTLERIGDGSQVWRAVRLFFTPTHVAWLMDSQDEQNYACRIARHGDHLEVGQPIEATAWYGAQTTDGLCVAFTTVEPGAGIHRMESAVLVSADAFHWQEVHTFRKDAWRPMRIFKNGILICPSGAMTSQELYLSGEGLRRLDGQSLRARVHWEGA
jgi:hypothetical protein